MKQQEINKLWGYKVESNIGELCYLVQPEQGIKGLRKPYQFELPANTAKALVADLKVWLKPYSKKLQCDLVDKKTVTYGIKLDIFLLGYKSGFTGDETGLKAQEWESITSRIRILLQSTLGENVLMYVDPWNETSKFQARFETYIKYSEL